MTITWIGHSTSLVRIGDTAVLIDPVWSDRASPVSWAGPSRLVPPGVPLDELPVIHAVLISHNHYDHLDIPTLERLGNGPEYIVPLGVGETLERHGIGPVRELDWWESVDIRSCTVTAAPAQHFSSRSLLDRNDTLWCGFTVRGGGKAVYYAGDTGWFPEFDDIGNRLGPFDALLLPVGAWLPEWFMGPVHAGPEDALKARDLLGGGVMVPVHWGTFRLADDPPGLAPSVFLDLVHERGLGEDEYWLPAFGETRGF